MTQYAQPLHADVAGKVTSAVYENGQWRLYILVDDGDDTTVGAKADSPVVDPDASGSVVALLKGLLDAPAITRTAYTAGAIACDRFHGYALQNTSSTTDDIAEVLVRFGNSDAATPFVPVRLAPGESATLYSERGIDVGASGIYVDAETAPASGAVEGVVFTS